MIICGDFKDPANPVSKYRGGWWDRFTPKGEATPAKLAKKEWVCPTVTGET